MWASHLRRHKLLGLTSDYPNLGSPNVGTGINRADSLSGAGFWYAPKWKCGSRSRFDRV